MLTVNLIEAEVRLCARYAANAEIGGSSSVRTDDRQELLSVDQMVGQVATLAGSKWLFGNAHGHYVYRMGRWAADRAPLVGDNGSDVPGANIDFKGSLIRNGSRDLQTYRLAVRPRERHPGTVYVLVLVEPGYATAHLMGWAVNEELPEPCSDGVFAGASIIEASRLHRCPPIRWSL